VVLINDADEILFLEGRERGGTRRFWVMPGGGLEPGESFAEAAVREAYEEAGLQVELEACLWTRHHVFKWQNRPMNQFEVFYAARVGEADIQPRQQDSYIHVIDGGHCWSWKTQMSHLHRER